MLAVTSYITPLLLLVHFAGTSSAYSRQTLRQSCPAEEEEEWSYRGDNGPENWNKVDEACGGEQQSPISIDTSELVDDPYLPKLEMENYDKPITSGIVRNNGHTLQLTPTDGITRSISVKNSTYKLAQCHFHWGDSAEQGSEHVIDDYTASMEMHCVHMNEDNEIAVVAVFFTEFSGSEGCNSEIQNLFDVISDVLYKGDKTSLHYSVNLNKLVPENPSSFYRYIGSLTTPGCSEGVTWSLLPQYQWICKEQMDMLRKMYSVSEDEATDGCKLVNNFRPPQPLNGRKVYASQYP